MAEEAWAPAAAMAERPEDLNLPNAVITRIIKEAVSRSGKRAAGDGQESRREAGLGPAPLLIPFSSQLPDGVNISKEARSAISRAASVFVLYATSW